MPIPLLQEFPSGLPPFPRAADAGGTVCYLKQLDDEVRAFVRRCRAYPKEQCGHALQESAKVCLEDRRGDRRKHEAAALRTNAEARQESAGKFAMWEVALLIVGAIGLGFGVGAAAGFVAGR